MEKLSDGFTEVSDEFIDDLLTPDPVTHHDIEMGCSSRGCGSPTYLKLKGVPYCYAHIIRKANELLKEYEKLNGR